MPEAPDNWRDRGWRMVFFVGYRVMLVWWAIRRPVMHGAYVAVWWRGRLLVIRNSYKRPLSVPCGMIGRRESPRRAAARELAEEVGIDVAPDALREVGEFVVEWEHKEDHAHFFELELEEAPALRLDGREVVWGEFVPEEELPLDALMPHVRHYLETRGSRG